MNVPQQDGGGVWRATSRDTAGTPGLRRNNPHSGSERGSDRIHNPEDRRRAPPRRLARQDPPPYEPSSLPSFSADDSARLNVVRDVEAYRDGSAWTFRGR